MCSNTGSRILRASSGSRSASSSIEPLRSANSTVTCLRSPSRAALEVRIFSARCFGVYVWGEVKCGSVEGWADPREVPQPLQNRLPAGLLCRQEGQDASSPAPHELQKRAVGGLS